LDKIGRFSFEQRFGLAIAAIIQTLHANHWYKGRIAL
jgi:hypothetical protein